MHMCMYLFYHYPQPHPYRGILFFVHSRIHMLNFRAFSDFRNVTLISVLAKSFGRVFH